MADNLPTIYTDCNGKMTTVRIGNAVYFFSYTTCVGVRFYSADVALSAVSENVWSMTTGKHLNTFSDKRDRIPHDLFLRVLALISKGDKRSLTTAQRLMDTHRGLTAAGIKGVA